MFDKFYVDVPEKIEAFVQHIFEECEQEGFTEYEVETVIGTLGARYKTMFQQKRKTTPFIQ